MIGENLQAFVWRLVWLVFLRDARRLGKPIPTISLCVHRDAVHIRQVNVNQWLQFGRDFQNILMDATARNHVAVCHWLSLVVNLASNGEIGLLAASIRGDFDYDCFGFCLALDCLFHGGSNMVELKLIGKFYFGAAELNRRA